MKVAMAYLGYCLSVWPGDIDTKQLQSASLFSWKRQHCGLLLTCILDILVSNLGSDIGYHVRFEVFTAVTMKNVVFWDIKTQFVLHRRHITSLLQSPAS
jgi:hypothetical protein